MKIGKSVEKNELGLNLKMGYSNVLTKHLIIDMQMGIGERFIKTTENIWSCTGYDGSIPNNYPLISSNYNFKPEIFLALTIGICK